MRDFMGNRHPIPSLTITGTLVNAFLDSDQTITCVRAGMGIVWEFIIRNNLIVEPW